jgi:hypothetical protein
MNKCNGMLLKQSLSFGQILLANSNGNRTFKTIIERYSGGAMT